MVEGKWREWSGAAITKYKYNKKKQKTINDSGADHNNTISKNNKETRRKIYIWYIHILLCEREILIQRKKKKKKS